MIAMQKETPADHLNVSEVSCNLTAFYTALIQLESTGCEKGIQGNVQSGSRGLNTKSLLNNTPVVNP